MDSEKGVITAEMGLFSGRPNPEISLTGDDAEEFARLSQSAFSKRTIEQQPPPARLGEYYGFQVNVPAGLANEIGLPQEFSVNRGIVTEQSGRERKNWRDEAGIEDFLIQKAYEQGHEELLKLVGFKRSSGESDPRGL